MANIKKMSKQELLLLRQYLDDQIERLEIMIDQKKTLYPDPYPYVTFQQLIRDQRNHGAEWREVDLLIRIQIHQKQDGL